MKDNTSWEIRKALTYRLECLNNLVPSHSSYGTKENTLTKQQIKETVRQTMNLLYGLEEKNIIKITLKR